MSDKMREEFEAAYKAACLERPIPRFDTAVFVKDHCDDYLNSLVQSAWWAWKASRASIRVDLPHLFPFYREGVTEALHAQGIKVNQWGNK